MVPGNAPAFVTHTFKPEGLASIRFVHRRGDERVAGRRAGSPVPSRSKEPPRPNTPCQTEERPIRRLGDCRQRIADDRAIDFLFRSLSESEPENPWTMFWVAPATPSTRPTMLRACPQRPGVRKDRQDGIEHLRRGCRRTGWRTSAGRLCARDAGRSIVAPSGSPWKPS